MKTYQEAVAIAQQWETEQATGPAALVGRALLAHINSLASPQVTDEQILYRAVSCRIMVGPSIGKSGMVDSGEEIIKFVRGILALSSLPASAVMDEQITPAMIAAGMKWLTHFQHMRKGDKESALEEAFKAMRALSAPPAAETLADDTNITKMIPTIEESLSYFETSSVDGMRIRHGKNLAAFLRKVRGGAVMGYVARNDRDPNGEVHFSYTSEGRNLEDGTPLLAGITDYEAARTESYRKGVNDERARQAEERAAAPQEAKPVAAVTKEPSGYFERVLIPKLKLLSNKCVAAQDRLGSADLNSYEELRAKYHAALNEFQALANPASVLELVSNVERLLAAAPQEQAPADKDAVTWAASKWDDEVANRPLVNVHRRALDDTWRQVIRHFGGDDVSLCGPRHDDLIALQSQPQQVTK